MTIDLSKHSDTAGEEEKEETEELNVTPCFAEKYTIKIGLLPPKLEKATLSGYLLLAFNVVSNLKLENSSHFI